MYVRAAAKRHGAGFLRGLLLRRCREIPLVDAGSDGAQRERASSGTTPEEACVRNALREAVHRAIDELSVRHRELLRRHYLSGESASEIAADRGVTVGAVEQVLHRARLSIRRGLAREGWMDSSLAETPGLSCAPDRSTRCAPG